MKTQELCLAVAMIGFLGCQAQQSKPAGLIPIQTPPAQVAPRPEVGTNDPNRMAVEYLRRAADDAISIEGEDAQLHRPTLLARIAEAQIGRRDFDGAMRTILAMRKTDQEMTLIDLAMGQSAAGDEQGLPATLAGLDDGVRPRIQERAMRNLAIAQARAGKHREALATAEKVTCRLDRIEAISRIAVDMARAGDMAQSEGQIRQALQLIDESGGDLDKPVALVSVCRAQLEANDPRVAVSLERLSGHLPGAQDAWSRLTATLGLAEMLWQDGRRDAANQAYDQARQAAERVDKLNTRNAFQRIALSRVAVGNIVGAKQAIVEIPLDPNDFTAPGDRERVWFEVAMAQLKTGDLAGALKSARQIEHFTQFRGDAILQIIPPLARRGKVKEALIAAEECNSPSRRAQGVMEVAIVQAIAGNKTAAKSTAARTSLLKRSYPFGPERIFQYQDPETWTTRYDSDRFYTNLTGYFNAKYAGELAGATVRFHVALGDTVPEVYASAFNKLGAFDQSILWDIAKAQSSVGDATGAKLWIGRLTNPVLRASALLGLAEGLPGTPSPEE